MSVTSIRYLWMDDFKPPAGCVDGFFRHRVFFRTQSLLTAVYRQSFPRNYYLASAVLLLCLHGHAAADRPPLVVEDLLERADSARVQGKYDVEFASLSFAEVADSTDARPQWRLARAYVEQGELAREKSEKRELYAAAVQHGKAAIANDSLSCIAYTWLAIAEGTSAGVVGFKQRVKLAWRIRDHALKAIELDSASDIAYHIMARWNTEIASIGGLKRAMANVFYGKLPNASYQESVVYYQKAIALNDQIHHRLELAKVYIKMKEYAEAQEELEYALAMQSEKRLDEKYKDEARLLLEDLP